MKYTNSLLKGLSFLLLLSISPLNLDAQCISNCLVQCQGQVNVSLDQSCTALITPAMGGVGIEPPCNDYYDLQLWDVYDDIVYDNIVDISHDGQLLKYEITEPECGNKCWGHIYVEYKLPPQIECPPDMTLTCGALNILSLPPATGGCADFEVELFSEVREPFNCNPLYTGKVTRTYIARDELGNQSECSHMILLERIDLDAIIFPEIRTVGNGNAISCKDPLIEFDENGIPLPWPTDPLTGSGSGVPILCDPNVEDGLFCPLTGSGNGVPLIPDGLTTPSTNITTAMACNAAVFYTDVELPKIGCVRKIMRTWEVREWWCTAEYVAGSLQLIEIVDDQAPYFVCPPDFTVTTDHDCAGHVYMPSVNAYDECGTVLNYSIEYPNGLLMENGGHIELDLGHNNVKYKVADDCYNDRECYVNVYVTDNTNPVAICERDKVVSLTTTEFTYVEAEPFDNGSWDECQLDRFEVRRMDTICVAADTLFGESVAFCCADVGRDDVMVVFRAWDKAGNYNDCMINVEVQDKVSQSLICPPDMTIDCREGYDLNNLSITFGGVSSEDNCSASNATEIVDADVNQCGVGTIFRIWELYDQDSNVIKHCKQVITITNNDPFVGSSIIWPLDYEQAGACSLADLSPENLPEGFGFPQFPVGNDECSLLGMDYEDSVFQAIPGSGECAHIERRWSVIDWCNQLDGRFVIWEAPRPQILKLINDIAPEIDDQGDVVFESQSIDCINSNVVIERTATDDCQNALFWTFTLFNQNGVAIGYGNSNILLDTLPTGFYEIEWTVQDGCGNFDIDYQNLEVRNIKAPSPICIHGLAANLVPWDTDNDGIPDTEKVELWAEDFDAKSYHSCGNPIVLSLTQDTTVKSRVYDCDDIGINTVQLWVTDVVTGAQDYCETFVDIQDNNNEDICDPDSLAGRVVIQGDIFTEEDAEVEGVQVGIGIEDLYSMTDENGIYAFSPMLTGGSYSVLPQKDDEHLNGISTLDLIMMQRHILGMEPLNSPYKMIAADVNNNQEITSIDLIELRKLILGVYDELPENTSWRFVDAEYDFIDPYNPWLSAIPEDYEIYDLNSNMDIDFVGVKIGDINGSVVANARDNQEEQKLNEELVFNIPAIDLQSGITGSIIVTSENYNSLRGWQTGLSYNSDVIEITSITGLGLENFNETNYFITDNSVHISYHSFDAESFETNDELFEITYVAKKDILKTNVVHIDAGALANESYNDRGLVQNLRLSTPESDIAQAEILSVQPNPWVEKAKIKFAIPTDGNVDWRFMDINGRLIYEFAAQYSKGEHYIEIDKTQLGTQGVIYIQMITDSGIKDYKMLIL